MELKKLVMAMAVTGASVALTACGGSDDDNNDNDSAFVTCNEETKVCTLEGTMTENYTLTKDYEYRLSGLLQVGEGNVDLADAAEMQAVKNAGVTLTIEPGVHVKANSDGVLLVTRGSKLIADGKKSDNTIDPITFSSRQDDDFDGLGEWGGVVIQGFAPHYGAGNTGFCGGDVAVTADVVCNVEGEGGDFIGNFGGGDKADNSGVIRYVRIAEAGKVAGPNNEINGLTLQGVGHGTTVEYVQVHGNQDDGIEWFGGTVNVKYAVLTNNDDDAIDFDEGYMGNIQYAIVLQNQADDARPVGSNDPRGIEANSSDEDYVPQTAATLANISVINGPISGAARDENGDYIWVDEDGNVVASTDPEADYLGAEPGVRFRGSVNVDFINSVVATTDHNKGCIRIDSSDHDEDSNTAKIATPVNLVNVMASNCGLSDEFPKDDTTKDSVTATGLVSEVADFDTAWALTNTAATVTAPTIEATDNGSNFVFDQTTYIGAVEPGTPAASAWYAGWIIPGSLDD
ncbi:hypothetical protein HF888_04570 [Bermanella marisrubri]|uniref:Putative lipoprotein n=1 Tax=Bermanella marisrubri TaxID=207949 RepID=Q1N1I0_9GAMM|nr:hypothetical protein [Bermanella marisrubri]EAT12070.1 putative lipoprotein [Oceanobacter sp. RED65] [Bermanella marisrubri]QIZ83537.1 hypothetical protein HF888_04570 [Bermanella marisrubri]